ncbi:MAG: glutamate--tRNA ligase [candidate division Zixibacteria bacterium RBG_16_50_21]|nr:MAG: glutamate--tRNA ligase [candidate division Zixibacteria bacterium RBG_16_50_21]
MFSTRPVRVRFAPSPTGRTHLGSGRTALYNYLLARQTGGRFILRIEDTDQKRFVPGAERELIDSLHWLGLDWDEGPDIDGPHAPYYQSERKEIYLKHARWLIENGFAYNCFCSSKRLEMMRQEQIQSKQNPHYDGLCRSIDPQTAAERARHEPHVVRFKMPEDGTISVKDMLRGEIVVENRNLDDYILVKSDTLALYHLAAMVDDHLMDISHVIRGSEWLSTFALHAHIIRAFGWQEPEWVHLSVFLKPSGKGKMSKRESSDLIKDGYSIFINDLRALGYLPEAVVNWIALMGWSYDDHNEFFSLRDLVERFSLERLNPAPAAINFSKLDHFNGLHIRNLPTHELARRISPYLRSAGYDVDFQSIANFVPLIRERLVTLDEAADWIGFLFSNEVQIEPGQLIGNKMSTEESLAAARGAYTILSDLPAINLENAEPLLRALADELGLTAGQLFGILRVAITGRTVSPPLFESMEILGKEKVLARLNNAVALLSSLSEEDS